MRRLSVIGCRSWRLARALARLLVVCVALANVPLGAFYQGRTRSESPIVVPAADAPPAPPRVRVNRAVPRVTRPPLEPVFSSTPTTAEITGARIFAEPLHALGEPSAEENRALATALRAFLARADREGWAPLQTFLLRFPASPWRASLVANLGTLHHRAGYYSRALALWEQAWLQARGHTDIAGRAVADYAVGQWLATATNFGKVREVSARLEELKGRDVTGGAVAKVAAAREGIWFLANLHKEALFSGPEALKAVLRVKRGESAPVPEAVKRYLPTHAGTSLADLRELASRSSLPVRALAHQADAPIPVPSIVHLRAEHFTAVIARDGDGYVLQDTALGGRFWVSAAALRDEMSGYVLVPEDQGADGRVVDGAEATNVVGHCTPGPPGDDDCKNCGGGGGGDGPGGPPSPTTPSAGMPTYQFHPVKASLLLTDTPVGYRPPHGPSVLFTLRYDHREQRQPQTFTYGNVGPNWTLEWLSYVTDNNFLTVPPWATYSVHLRGQSSEIYTGVDGSAPHWRSRARLVRVSTDPVRWERRLPDGTVEVFDLPDRGPTAPNRQIFLTQIIDPQGQTLTFTYDAQLRLVAITDALGQVSTLSYEHPPDPLKITKLTDPFGRFATLTYNTAGQLASITDVIGLTSSFAYDTGAFIAALTTPYGTTSFRHEPQPSLFFRFIEATDPLGGRERLEFRWSTTEIPATAPANQVPTGLAAQNQYLDHYNSLYWSKLAMARAPLDVNSAVITNWLLHEDVAYGHAWSRNVPHSIKRPLENRVWYRYPGQSPTDHHVAGVGTSPTLTARVLDDGSTHAWQAAYNDQGMVTSRTDPLGRQTSYTYSANGIDLLEVRQTTGGMNDLLATYGSYTTGHLPQTVTDAAGQTTSVTYNAASQVLTVTNAKNETTTYAYDPGGLGYLQSVTGPVSGATTSYTYDGYGRVRTVTDSDSYTLTTDYDAFDRPTRTTYPDTTFEETVYDRLDVMRRRDRLGRWSHFTHDALRRTTSTRDPLGRLIQQVWCGCGSLEALVDAKGQKTSWQRDVMGRMTSEIRADGTTTTSYVYETTTSRLKTVTDPKAQVTTYSYALDDALLGTAYTNAQIATPSVSYTYESNYARIATMVDGTGTTTYSYHPAGVLGAGQIATVDGPLANDTIAYGYDQLRRVVERSINGTSNTLSQAYDALGRVTSETNVLGTFTYGYDAVTRRLMSVTYPNGQTSAYAYYPSSQDHRLQTIHHKYPGGPTLSKFDYTYDSVGKILTWQQQAESDPPVVWTYGYDAADQLTRAVKQTTVGTPTVAERYAYGYDLAGNRTFEQIDDAVTGWTYDSLNQLVTQFGGGSLRFAGTVNEPATVTVQGLPAAVSGANTFERALPVTTGTTTVTIAATDSSGNTAVATYEVDVAANGATFAYDAAGNMTSDGSRQFEWNARDELVAIVEGTRRTEFMYDSLGRRVRETERDNSVTTSDKTIVWCRNDLCEVRDAVSGAVDQRFLGRGVQEAVDSRWETRDHLGSVRELTDASAIVQARYDFGPYGRRTKVSGSADTRRGFAGMYVHDGSGLSFAKYRAYATNTARWLSRDPLGFVDGPSVYAYVENRPVSWLDPLGLWGVNLPGTNYCGPGPYGDDADTTPTTGYTDQACKIHDSCYGSIPAILGYPLPGVFWDDETNCLLDGCDNALCKAMVDGPPPTSKTDSLNRSIIRGLFCNRTDRWRRPPINNCIIGVSGKVVCW